MVVSELSTLRVAQCEWTTNGVGISGFQRQMRIFRLWSVAVARAHRRHWLAWVIDADLLHHATIFMAEDVAVEHEVTNNARPREWNHDLHFAADGHGEGVSVEVKRLRNPVDLQDLEVKLVNVEHMQFVRGVANDPLLIVAVTD